MVNVEEKINEKIDEIHKACIKFLQNSIQIKTLPGGLIIMVFLHAAIEICKSNLSEDEFSTVLKKTLGCNDENCNECNPKEDLLSESFRVVLH